MAIPTVPSHSLSHGGLLADVLRIRSGLNTEAASATALSTNKLPTTDQVLSETSEEGHKMAQQISVGKIF